MNGEHVTWHDAFRRELRVGSRVAYPRTPAGGGGYVYVIGVITGPARLDSDIRVSLRLTENSMKLLAAGEEWRLKTGERKRPVSGVVASVGTASLILVEEGVDVIV